VPFRPHVGRLRASALLAPATFALRRARARRVDAALTALVFAAACGIVGSLSLIGAIARREATADLFRRIPSAERSVVSRVGADPAIRGSERNETAASRVMLGLRDIAGAPALVRVWGPVAPADERGTRVVRTLGVHPRLVAGRRPRECRASRCEGVALGREPRLGVVVRWSGVSVRVVGRATLPAAAVAARPLLGRRSVLVGGAAALSTALTQVRHFSARIAALDERAVVHRDPADVATRLRTATVRLSRLGPAAWASAPAGAFGRLDARLRASQRRMLMVGIQGVALLVAFAAFLASMRRREGDLARAQLVGFGASRWQISLARAVELALPALLGFAVALVALLGAAPAELVSRALTGDTVLTLAGVALAGAGSMAIAARPRAGRVTGLEVAAFVALAVVVWQAAGTAGLEPEQLSKQQGAVPIVLFVPVLSLLVAAAVLLRALPLALRLGERVARHGPLTARLALLGAVRRPDQPIAATTFVAISVGVALFSLNYRQTLAEQVSAAADYHAGAPWRVTERAPLPLERSVAPLTRFSALTPQSPTPVLRLPGLDITQDPASAPSLEVLGIPHDRLPAVLGWQRGYSASSPAELGRRLSSPAARLRGPALSDGAREIRTWAKAPVPRTMTLWLLEPGQRFRALPGAMVSMRWTRVIVKLPRLPRGTELAAITLGGVSARDSEAISMGALRERLRGGRSTELSDLEDWTTAPGNYGGSSVLPAGFAHAPIRRGIQASFTEIGVPLLRPGYSLPAALPAIASPDLAARAVDGHLSVSVRGYRLTLDVVGRSRLFPTVTRRPQSFVVLDYATLFAALNAYTPRNVEPTEAWFAGDAPGNATAALRRAPFHGARLTTRDALRTAARSDALAVRAEGVLLATAVLAALLAALGMALAASAIVADERVELAEYEALGIEVATLAGALRLRLLLLAAAGVVAAVAGAIVAVRLVSALVSVTAGAAGALPPIQARVAFVAGGALLAAVGLALVLAARRAGQELARPGAERLRG
jgi:hypothetical protein